MNGTHSLDMVLVVLHLHLLGEVRAHLACSAAPPISSKGREMGKELGWLLRTGV
jgi:hypothetical protein